MKVLHVFKTARPASFGGVESFIDNLCKADSKLGVKNTVFTLHPEPHEQPIEMDGYTVIQAKQNIFVASTGFSFSAIYRFKRLVHCSDLVHYHFPNPFADILHFLIAPKIPTIVSYHSDIIRQKRLEILYKPLKKHFLNSVDHIVSTSPNYFATSGTLQNYSNKVSVIPIGLDPNDYETFDTERLDYWRRQFPKPFFLFVGVLRYYKGLDLAIEAVSRNEINLVIVGASGIEKKLKDKAASLQLKNIHFLGHLNDNDKIALLHLCYGFIFPSNFRSEAFGISLLEAAMVGKPMISCEIGTGTSFVNSANNTGIVVNPGSSLELTQAMQFLLDNPSIAKKMGVNAKKRAKILFCLEDQAKSYFNLYTKLISETNK